MAKKVIFLFGEPGAGKGTQAELLADTMGYYHLESSKVIERSFATEDPKKEFVIDGQTFTVEDEKKRWLSGELTSPPFIVQLMLERIKELAAEDKSIILSGSPRTIYEAEKEMPFFKELFGLENLTFFLLEVSAETTIFRNEHRRICELVRHSILFAPETEVLEICPLDGSKLVRRYGLDDPDTIKKRLQEFRERTYPVLDIIKSQGVEIHKINGERSVSEVHADIAKVIGEHS